jgi:hypothetical protein
MTLKVPDLDRRIISQARPFYFWEYGMDVLTNSGKPIPLALYALDVDCGAILDNLN